MEERGEERMRSLGSGCLNSSRKERLWFAIEASELLQLLLMTLENNLRLNRNIPLQSLFYTEVCILILAVALKWRPTFLLLFFSWGRIQPVCRLRLRADLQLLAAIGKFHDVWWMFLIHQHVVRVARKLKQPTNPLNAAVYGKHRASSWLRKQKGFPSAIEWKPFTWHQTTDCS